MEEIVSTNRAIDRPYQKSRILRAYKPTFLFGFDREDAEYLKKNFDKLKCKHFQNRNIRKMVISYSHLPVESCSAKGRF